VIAGAVIVAVAVLVVVLTSIGGSSGGKGATASAKTTTGLDRGHTKGRTHTTGRKAAPKAPVASPAETSVVVLNATEADGLAHRTAGELQQNGYSQATAMNGKPPGPGQVSVVEYTSGHRAEAEGVARAAAVTSVQPIEAAVTALAGSASVVVIVGADKDNEASSP
jgi:hypothetical protein